MVNYFIWCGWILLLCSEIVKQELRIFGEVFFYLMDADAKTVNNREPIAELVPNDILMSFYCLEHT